jgi:hypothetical protein
MTTVDRTFATTTTVPVATEWTRANLHIIAFVQEQYSRRIVGAGVARVQARLDTR